MIGAVISAVIGAVIGADHGVPSLSRPFTRSVTAPPRHRKAAIGASIARRRPPLVPAESEPVPAQAPSAAATAAAKPQLLMYGPKKL